MKIIEVNHLKKSFKEVKAVDDISFSVNEGELFAFLGVNGAGKSTTINIMCGSLEKDDGTIVINNNDISKKMNNVKRDIGIVFQNSVLDKKLTAYDNLKTKAIMYGMSNEEFNVRLEELIKLFDLSDILKKPLYKLSGGQKRRIDIARALVHSPKILILDEPTTGLDPSTRLMVWNVINDLRKNSNLTVFLTTHYMEEASEADNVVILDKGKIVAVGTPNELKNKYAKDFIKIYFNDNNEEKFNEILSNNKFNYKKMGDYFEIEINNVIDSKKIMSKYPELFEDFEIVKGKMDNVFLNVTGKDIKEVLQ